MELVTPDELRTWDRSGPRYTSFPTVPLWKELPAGAVDAALRGVRTPAQLYVHIPFCAEQCTFCGCNMVVAGRREIGAKYLADLASQIDRLPFPAEPLEVQRIHLGGGTPTWLSPKEMGELQAILLRRFQPITGAELSVEADPQITTPAHLEALDELGFNRLSLGVQSFDPVVLKAVNRPQWRSRIGDLMARARSLGWWGLNLDLIYGLPHQTTERFSQTLDSAIALRPDRFAVFGYAHVPWLKPHMNKLNAEALPTSGERAELYLMAQKKLSDAGYTPLGLDHFALHGDQLAVAARDRRLHRNFMGYTTLSQVDMIGLGMSAISEVAGTYWQDEAKLARWRNRVAQGAPLAERGWVLSSEDHLRRDVINRLMCNLEISIPGVEKAHTIEFIPHFKAAIEALRPLQEAGFVTVDEDAIRVTERGRVLVRNAAMVFDPYLARDETSGPRYSRTV